MSLIESNILHITAVIMGIWISQMLAKMMGPHLLKAALLGIGLIIVATVPLNFAYGYPSYHNNRLGYTCAWVYTFLFMCGGMLFVGVIMTIWKSKHKQNHRTAP